jgi:hypothetical protein
LQGRKQVFSARNIYLLEYSNFTALALAEVIRNYDPIRYWPIAESVKAKVPRAGKNDAKVQLGIWVAAQIKRLDELHIGRRLRFIKGYFPVSES